MTCIYSIHTHTRTPASCPAVEAYQYTDAESAERIVRWITGLRGRGAALYEDGKLYLPAEEFGQMPGFALPLGWYAYREGYGDRIHVAPERTFNWQYEVKQQ